MSLQLCATCAFGLEAVLARELKALGAQEVHSDNGQVSFQGDPLTLARANLWLRTADRVWLVLGSFPATTFEELFQGVIAVPWEELLPKEAEFPVTGFSVKSGLSSVPACQKIVKKAMVERLKKAYKLEWFPEDGPLFPVRFQLIKDSCKILLDTSGSGLHKRGYRTYNAPAPLRETLAAGLVLLSYWNKERPLYDPLCGSGTILLEAALIGLDRAPGWGRTHCSENWPLLPEAVWNEAREEVEDRFDRHTELQIFGSDQDGAVLKLARIHTEQAELVDRGIRFQKRPVEQFQSKKRHGVLITNPPYGHRLQGEFDIEALYQRMAEQLSPLRETWSLYFLTSHPDFARFFGQPARRRKLYNGKMPVTYYQYPGPPPKRPSKSAHEDRSP